MPNHVYLYSEVQISLPFSELDWKEANKQLKAVPGLISKIWLSGVHTNTVGGLYEFDSPENAQKFERGLLLDMARDAQAALTVKIFDKNATFEAS